MSVSVLLRLVPSALIDGRLAGQLELVDTGERALVQSTDELIAYLRERALRPEPPTPVSQERLQ